MKVNQKKANRIKGLFATLNKLELDRALSLENMDTFNSPQYVRFDCDISYSDVWDEFTCELSSQLMCRKATWSNGKYIYYAELAFGGHWPTTQTLWDDKCSYYEFIDVINFARNTIKAGGTYFMKYAKHTVTIDMHDYLCFELKEDKQNERVNE